MRKILSKQVKINIIIQILETLFPMVPIPLQHQDPFTLLVAVMLSGRSTDKMVNRVTPALFAKADTPETMARLSVAEIRAIIKPCGLSPAKSKNIRAMSQILVDRFDGKVPQTFEELESLPGVGHKTASVVMTQAFKKPAFPVDTHIFRLAHRWGLSKSVGVRKVEEDLKKLFPKKLWGKLHLQMIYFGRKYCPARGHKIDDCPLCSLIMNKKL